MVREVREVRVYRHSKVYTPNQGQGFWGGHLAFDRLTNGGTQFTLASLSSSCPVGASHTSHNLNVRLRISHSVSSAWL